MQIKTCLLLSSSHEIVSYLFSINSINIQQNTHLECLQATLANINKVRTHQGCSHLVRQVAAILEAEVRELEIVQFIKTQA